MAEQEEHGQQASGEQAGGRPPAIDSEQFRQYQQFQQFQEFQRFQELQRQAGDEPVPAPAPRRRRRAPWWLRWLGRKLLAWLIFFVLTAIALTWAVNSLILGADDDQQPPAAKTGGGKYHTNTILPTNPYEAVRGVYDAIAQDKRPLYTCGRFNRAARHAFAEDLGYGSCKQAAQDLHKQVENPNEYAESVPSSSPRPEQQDGIDKVRISSCDFDISGGPALGTFIVERVERGQWLIIGHRDGPESCPAPSTR